MKTTTPPTGHLGSRTFRQSAVLDAQLAVVHRLQSLLAKLPAVCQSVVINSSLLGSGAVVYLACVMVQWMTSAAVGFKAHLAMAVSINLCSILKTSLSQPRPYFVSKRVKCLDPTRESSFGLPSGHTTVMFTVFLYIAWQLRQTSPGLLPVAAVCTALVMLSRVASGAHFPGDVALGAVVGTCGIVFLETAPGWAFSWRFLTLCGAVTLFVALQVRATDNRRKVAYLLVKEGVSSAGLAFGCAAALAGAPVAWPAPASMPLLPSAAVAAVGVLPVFLMLPATALLAPKDAQGNRTVCGICTYVVVTAVMHCFAVVAPSLYGYTAGEV